MFINVIIYWYIDVKFQTKSTNTIFNKLQWCVKQYSIIYTSNFPPCRILAPQNPSLISDPKYRQSEEAAPTPDFSPLVLFEMIMCHRWWGHFPHKQSHLAHAPTLNWCCFFPSMRHSSQSSWHVSCPSTVEQQTWISPSKPKTNFQSDFCSQFDGIGGLLSRQNLHWLSNRMRMGSMPWWWCWLPALPSDPLWNGPCCGTLEPCQTETGFLIGTVQLGKCRHSWNHGKLLLVVRCKKPVTIAHDGEFPG